VTTEYIFNKGVF